MNKPFDIWWVKEGDALTLENASLFKQYKLASKAFEAGFNESRFYKDEEQQKYIFFLLEELRTSVSNDNDSNSLKEKIKEFINKLEQLIK